MSAETFTPKNPAEAPTIDDIVSADDAMYIVPSSKKKGAYYHMTPTEVSNGFVVLGGKAADGSGETQFKSMTIGDYLNNKERLPKLVVEKELGSDAVELANLEQESPDVPETMPETTEEELMSQNETPEAAIEAKLPKTLTETEKRDLQEKWLEAFGQVNTGKEVFQTFISRLEGRGQPVNLDEIQRTLRRYQPDATVDGFRRMVMDTLPGKTEDEWLRKVITQITNLNIHPAIADMIRYARTPAEAIDSLRSAISRVSTVEQTMRNLLRTADQTPR